MDKIGDCFKPIVEAIYGTNWTDSARISPFSPGEKTGLLSPPLLRFIGKEDGFLSHTNDGPRMYANVEDYKYYVNKGKRNQKFQTMMATFLNDTRCTSKEK